MQQKYRSYHEGWYKLAQRFTIDDKINESLMVDLCYARLGIKDINDWKCPNLYHYLETELLVRATTQALDSLKRFL